MFSLPTKYFERMDFDEGVDGIDGSAVESKKYKERDVLALCFRLQIAHEGRRNGPETEGPEYETVFSFGSNLLVDDIVSVMTSNELCDELGLDTISAGVTIGAYLMSEDEFENDELIHSLIEKIAYREGVGDTLAEGRRPDSR